LPWGVMGPLDLTTVEQRCFELRRWSVRRSHSPDLSQVAARMKLDINLSKPLD